MLSVELRAGRAARLTGAVWIALASAGGCVSSGPGPAPARGEARPQVVSAEPARPLPTLEQELAAKQERQQRKARSSGLPTLDEELRAKQAREAVNPPAATPPAAPTADPTPEPAAEPNPEPTPEPAPAPQPGPASADDFRPSWWIDRVVEENGRATAAATGEAASLVEARRLAVESARAALRGAIGETGSISDSPLNTAAVRLSDGRYRAFVLMEGRR